MGVVLRFSHGSKTCALLLALAGAAPAVAEERAVLVYAEQYSGNPASLFGHIFIRLADTARPEALDTIIGYFAEVPPDVSGLTYAYKGLFGGFAGHYRVSAYHHGLREYGDIENRGLWEYELALGPAGVARLRERLAAHAAVAIPYKFFTQNCATGLLDILAEADPAFSGLGRRLVYELPVDVVREVARHGLVKSIRYRPSAGAKLDALRGSLDAAGREAVDGLVSGRLQPGDVQSPAVLQTAAETLAFEGQREGKDVGPQLDPLLARRAALGGPPVVPTLPPAAAPPHGTHPPTSIALGAAGGPAGERSLLLRFRPGVHSLMDPSEGTLRHTEMEVLTVEVRKAEAEAVRLERLRFLGLRHIAPATASTTLPSWGLLLDAREPEAGCFGAEAEGQVGYATDVAEALTVYGLAAVRGSAARCLPRGAELRAIAYAGGMLELGALKSHLYAQTPDVVLEEAYHFPAGWSVLGSARTPARLWAPRWTIAVGRAF